MSFVLIRMSIDPKNLILLQNHNLLNLCAILSKCLALSTKRPLPRSSKRRQFKFCLFVLEGIFEGKPDKRK